MDLKQLKYQDIQITLGIYYSFKVYIGGEHHKQIKHLMGTTCFIARTIKQSYHKT